ncbi:Maf family protein [Amphritea sp. HPY]|uniref:Maf family protein n=1 Tax=Amphritea sp. HPY TaxID=3421652 RepID=UPI003D7E730B
MAELVLASASPRRRELLSQIGVNCEVLPVDIAEIKTENESATEFVERMAREKVQAAVNKLSAGNISTKQTSATCSFIDKVVLGSDTVVVHQGIVMGKPADRAESIAMLQRLSGDEHHVLTAVAVADREQIESIVVSTLVRFRELPRALCEQYWDSGEPRDKAGSYGIQGLGAVFVAGIEGSYSSVVGLPLTETAELLEKFDIAIWQQSTE